MATATAIAQECGILPPKDAPLALGPASKGAAVAGAAVRGAAAAADCGCNGSASEAAVAGGMPDGVVMEGPEFRRRVLNADGSINAGALQRGSGRVAVLPAPGRRPVAEMGAQAS